MDDLISRQAAIDALDEIESEVADGYGFQYEKWRKHFTDLPSAPERKTGKWIPLISTSDRKRHEWCGYQCSICGERTLRLTQCNFCPNCGSYNGGKQDGER